MVEAAQLIQDVGGKEQPSISPPVLGLQACLRRAVTEQELQAQGVEQAHGSNEGAMAHEAQNSGDLPRCGAAPARALVHKQLLQECP